MSAALLMLSQKPVREISVNDLIVHEDVSRGTFYKYFDSLAEVFSRLSIRLETELSPVADHFIAQIPSAALRVATGTRLILQIGSQLPVVGQLMLHSGWPVERSAGVFLRHLNRDIRLAMEQKSFDEMPASLASNLIVGPMLGGLQTMLTEKCAPDYAAQLTHRILLSLGMNPDSAKQAVSYALPGMDLQPTGLVGEIINLTSAR